MKKRGLIFLSMAALCVLFCFAKMGDVKAEESTEEDKIYNLNITVERNYDYAKQVLDIVNEERQKAGVGTVQMDEELTEAAMTRAKEITADYAHARANGLPMRTLTIVIAMENAGCAGNTPEIIMDAWMNSDGHRRNILDSSWTSVGIGCIKYNGIYYWTQLFSEKDATGTIPNGQTCGEESIEVCSDFLNLTSSITNDPVIGTGCIELSQPCRHLECYSFKPNPSSFTFESSNPNIATIDASGTVNVLRNGTTTITAYYAGTEDVAHSQTISCTVDTGTVPAVSPSVTPTNSSVSTSTNKETVSSTSSYKVTYYCDVVFRKRNGERPTVKQVKKYSTVRKIKNPTKKGYTFVGWYKKNGKKFNFSKKIRSSTVLYAKWKKK